MSNALVIDCIASASGTGAIAVSVGDQMDLYFCVCSATTDIVAGSGATANVYGCVFDTSSEIGSGVVNALAGDRSAFDALDYATRHTNDTDDSATAIHHTLGTGADQAAAGNHTHTISPGSISLTNTHILVGNGSNIAADVAMSNDATMANTGALTIANGAVTYAKIQNISATQRTLGRNTAGAGVTEEVTASQIVDWIGNTRGAVLYRGASGWAILAPGSIGQVLTSNGSGNDPTYQDYFLGAISVYNETQSGVGGGIKTYYLYNIAAANTVRAYINGIRQPVADTTVDSDVITFSTAPAAGDTLMFDYELSLI